MENKRSPEKASPSLDNNDSTLDVPIDIPEDKNSIDTNTANTEHQERSIEPENEAVGWRLVVIHIGATLATFLAGLDSNLIATSIPVITSEFNSIGDVGWYGSAFYIAMCTSQPLAGKIYMLFSKKIAILSYLFLFELGNLVCALAPSSPALIAGRVITGLGAAGVFVGTFVILATIIPLPKRVMWQGITVTIFSIASIVGPPIGGALTQALTWRWCFWINLPFGGLAGALFLFLNIRKPDPAAYWPLLRKIKALDFTGLVLLAGSMTMLLMALQFGGVDYRWSSSVVIGLFVGAGVACMLFVCWVIYHGDDALIPRKLFGIRNASLLLASSIFGAGPFQVIIYWLPIWFQAVLGVSPLDSGVRYLPTVIADALTCLIGSAMITQLGIWNPFLLLAYVFISLSGGLLSTIYPGQSSGHWVGYQVLGGIGYGLINNCAHIGMQASIPKELIPVASSSLMSTLSVSCAIFLAMGQTLFQGRLVANLTDKVPQELIRRLLASGATNIRKFISPAELPTVIDGYSKSINQVFYLAAFAPVVGFAIASGLNWTSLKKGKTVNDLAGNEPDNEIKV